MRLQPNAGAALLLRGAQTGAGFIEFHGWRQKLIFYPYSLASRRRLREKYKCSRRGASLSHLHAMERVGCLTMPVRYAHALWKKCSSRTNYGRDESRVRAFCLKGAPIMRRGGLGGLNLHQRVITHCV